MGVPFLSTNAGYNILQVNTSGENEETRFTLPSGRITISNYGIVSSGLERHLGNATNKWGNLYLSGTVQGASSEKLKQEIAPVDDRLFQAWSEVEFCQYRLRNGDRRIHIGVIAEKIEQTLEAHGYRAEDLALISKEDGVYTVNFFEVLFLEAAYQRWRAEQNLK